MQTKFILWLLASIFFTLAFVLDVSTSGGWKYINIGMVFFTLLLIFAGGLFFALFLFQKKKYTERISLTIPIAAMLFSLFIFSNVIIEEYGLSGKYNYFSAKRDIRNGKIQVLITGFILPTGNEKAEEAVRNQFGYKTIWIGCTIRNGVDKYNSVMEEYLDKMNQKNWRLKERQELDSLSYLKKSN